MVAENGFANLQEKMQAKGKELKEGTVEHFANEIAGMSLNYAIKHKMHPVEITQAIEIIAECSKKAVAKTLLKDIFGKEPF